MTLAIIFDSVGAGEWLVLLAVLLVVMGPKRLPATARKVGAYYSKFRRAAESFKRQLMDMDLEMEREFQKAEEEAKQALDVPEAGAEGAEAEVKAEGEAEPRFDAPAESAREGVDGDQSHQES